MKVFKFGGASLSSSQGFERVGSIIKNSGEKDLIVVVSAIGKTTNALEKIFDQIQKGEAAEINIRELESLHCSIARDLIKVPDQVILEIRNLLNSICDSANTEDNPDARYDEIVSKGELLSSLLMYSYLIQFIGDCQFLDARTVIVTDRSFSEANIEWAHTTARMTGALKDKTGIIITQGFIGSTITGKTTTLGRDGSDYSAAIFASCLSAESVTIWKDVPGVMNADPKRIPQAEVFPELPYREAAEMTYYGASVIHPKTIKPLANLGIPLMVKSFLDPALSGTVIHECRVEGLAPLVVFKENQCLISCKGLDYTFITENQLSVIFKMISTSGLRINVMQNSAISFSFCTDFKESKVYALIEKLSREFEVYYNTGLTLITIKNYNQEIFDTYRKMKGILLEQSSRSTLQILVR